jgi:hypothetical protein
LTGFVSFLSEVEALVLWFPVQDVSSQGLWFLCSNSLVIMTLAFSFDAGYRSRLG